MSETRNILKRQRYILAAALCGIFCFVFAIGYMIVGEEKYQPLSQKKPINLPGDKINPQDIWMTKMEGEKKLFEQKLKYLEDLMLESKKKEEDYQLEKDELKKEIAVLGKRLREKQAEPAPQKIVMEDPFLQKGLPPSIKSPLVELVMEDLPTRLSHVDKVIPSGTTVKALLVSSVDATCGVYSASDPIPVKLRILDNAHLPKEVNVKLKDGIIIGSAHGNLSSERVYIRIERLTQVKPEGLFIETEVGGYVSGEDGKYGVRGTIVDKSFKAVSNAAASGFFSEIGQVLQSFVSRRGNSYQVDNISVKDDILAPGFVGGGSSAFDMIAEYYLKRAEQLQPVIQVSAGRIVDITFTHGASVGDLHTQDRIRELREKSKEKTNRKSNIPFTVEGIS